MKDHKRDILKRLANGRLPAHEAARELTQVQDGITKVHLHIRYPDGTHYYDGDTLTDQEYKQRIQQEDPYGTRQVIYIGGAQNE